MITTNTRLNLMSFLSDFIGGITGSTAAKAAKKSAQIQQEAAQQAATDVSAAGESALSRFDPLEQIGQRGFELSGFLADPTQQAQFLQSNPLFDLGLQNLNQQTQSSAAARGRLSAGDTLEQLQQNAILAGQPLLQDQRSDVLNLLNIGAGTIGQQAGIERQTAADVANLLTGGAAAEAAGVVGAANARSGLAGNIMDIAGLGVGSGLIPGFGGAATQQAASAISPASFSAGSGLQDFRF